MKTIPKPLDDPLTMDNPMGSCGAHPCLRGEKNTGTRFRPGFGYALGATETPHLSQLGTTLGHQPWFEVVFGSFWLLKCGAPQKFVDKPIQHYPTIYRLSSYRYAQHKPSRCPIIDILNQSQLLVLSA